MAQPITIYDALTRYEQEHTRHSTRLTHMVGIPMILASLIVVWFDWTAGVVLFVGGWVLQFVGHWIFEKNDPAFFQRPVYLIAGVVWVAREWCGFVLSNRRRPDSTVGLSEVPLQTQKEEL